MTRERPPRLFEALRRHSAATLHEAACRDGAMPRAIQALAPGMEICGPAFVVRSPGGSNLAVHRAVGRAREGDVLVIATRPGPDAGFAGELLVRACRSRRLGGIVMDNCARDTEALAAAGFPVFCTGRFVAGTAKTEPPAGEPGAPVRLGEVTIHHGDIIRGDADGVVRIRRGEAERVLEAARLRDAEERRLIRGIDDGEPLLRAMGLDGPAA